MTIVWLVSLKRFLYEFENHIANTDRKNINWFVDDDGYVRMYIEQTNGSNVYCYIHKGNADTIPLELKSFILEMGSVLGIEGIDDNDIDSVEEKVDEISSRLKIGALISGGSK